MESREYQKMRRLEDHYWWFVGRRRAVLSLLQRYLPQGRKVLVGDIGCGTGATSVALKQFGKVVAVDLSPEALKLHSSRNDHGEMVRASAVSLPFKSETFDVLTYLDMLEHVEEDELALEEAFRLLRPGGWLLLSVPAHPWLWGKHDVSLHHKRRYTRTELLAKLDRAGFQLVRCSWALFLLAPLAVAYRLAGRLWPKGKGSGSEVAELPSFLNRCLVAVMDLEAKILARADLPLGVSLMCLVRKPERSQKEAEATGT